jgi:predicted ester cyclase
MLKESMDEAVGVIQKWFEKKFKVTPGIIAGLHTFGSRLNFNPHVHEALNWKKIVKRWSHERFMRP